MSSRDDDILRTLGEMQQQLRAIDQEVKANNSNSADIRQSLGEMSGSLAVVISWAEENKKKLVAFPPLFAG